MNSNREKITNIVMVGVFAAVLAVLSQISFPLPSGIPVATVAINGVANAGNLAAKILAASDPELLEKLKAYTEELKSQVVEKDEKLQETGYKNYGK